jgi:chromosome segregation ATPase
LRHQAVEVQESSPANENPVSDDSVSAIDHALMDLDSKLENSSKNIEELDNAVNNLKSSSTDNLEERSFVVAKRDHVLQEWENIQKESEELRKELSDDKWLVVFRSVTEQADDMLASLEKILTQCQVCNQLRLCNRTY